MLILLVPMCRTCIARRFGKARPGGPPTADVQNFQSTRMYTWACAVKMLSLVLTYNIYSVIMPLRLQSQHKIEFIKPL